MWSAPPAASASAWNATASIRRPWSAPWPACQARHSPARAAPVASGPAANARPWPAADPASAAPPRSAAAALPSPWAAASAPLATDALSATGEAWSASSPPAAAATPPIDSTATSAAAAALIVSTLRGTAVLRGTRVGGCDRILRCEAGHRRLLAGQLLGGGRACNSGQQPGQPAIPRWGRRRIQPALQELFQEVLVSGWQRSFWESKRWMHVGP